jgi:hypothetical protein
VEKHFGPVIGAKLSSDNLRLLQSLRKLEKFPACHPEPPAKGQNSDSSPLLMAQNDVEWAAGFLQQSHFGS